MLCCACTNLMEHSSQIWLVTLPRNLCLPTGSHIFEIKEVHLYSSLFISLDLFFASVCELKLSHSENHFIFNCFCVKKMHQMNVWILLFDLSFLKWSCYFKNYFQGRMDSSLCAEPADLVQAAQVWRLFLFVLYLSTPVFLSVENATWKKENVQKSGSKCWGFAAVTWTPKNAIMNPNSLTWFLLNI